MNIHKEHDNKIAFLETKNDLLETELAYIDSILLQCGFPEGIKTLKKTIEELLTESSSDLDEDESQLI